MLDNLPKEIIYYSVIPVCIIVIIDILLFIFLKKKEDNAFRFNYLIEISLILAISLVLPVIIGYTIWIIKTFMDKEIFDTNLLYIALLIFLCIALTVVIIWIYMKTLKNLSIEDDNKKLLENEKDA